MIFEPNIHARQTTILSWIVLPRPCYHVSPSRRVVVVSRFIPDVRFDPSNEIVGERNGETGHSSVESRGASYSRHQRHVVDGAGSHSRHLRDPAPQRGPRTQFVVWWIVHGVKSAGRDEGRAGGRSSKLAVTGTRRGAARALRFVRGSHRPFGRGWYHAAKSAPNEPSSRGRHDRDGQV
jgi:hypothetical protein